MSIRYLSLILLIALLPQAHAGEAVTIQELSRSSYWHRLLHYKKRTILRGFKSEIVNDEFFISPDGRTDPFAEIKATVEVFTQGRPLVMKLGSPAVVKADPQCVFPERYHFLKTQLHLAVADTACPDFIEWKKSLGAESATLVFSAAYPNNPASMFGHTLLRINKNTETGGGDLLQYGLNFGAAIPPSDGSFKYVVWGLAGGYYGKFALSPYYMKVNEYSDSESRDLWEYNLVLSQDQIDRMVRHLWELHLNADFGYFFLDKNCSYQILALLEVANENWEFTDQFTGYVLPADTIKLITDEPGAVSSVAFRPSSRKKMLAKRKHLSPDETRIFKNLVQGKLASEEVKNPVILDAVIAYLDYAKNRDEGKTSDTEKEIFRQVLVARSRLGKTPGSPGSPGSNETSGTIAEGSRPDLGHESTALGFSSGHQEAHPFVLGLNFKAGLHDLLNQDVGYEPFSEISFAQVKVDYLSDVQKLNIDVARLMAISSFYPLDTMDLKPSWSTDVKYDRIKDLNCDYCHRLFGDFGVGLGTHFFSKNTMLYGLAFGDVEASGQFSRTFRVGPAFETGMILNPGNSHYKLQGKARINFDLVRNDASSYYTEYEINQSYGLSRSWDMRILADVVQRINVINRYEESIVLNYYY